MQQAKQVIYPYPFLRDSEEQKPDWGLAILYKLKLNQQYVFTIE